MTSLPTILLILAAMSMGATVIAALVAFRSQREAVNAIFPIVREEENNRAQRARISIFIWVAITALFLGGWLATLRLGASNDSDVAAITAEDNEAAVMTQPEQPAEEVAAVRLVTNTPLPETKPSPAGATVAALVGQATPVSLSSNTPAPAIEASIEASTSTPSPEPPATVTPTPLPPTATSTDTPEPAAPSPTPTETPTATPALPAPTPTIRLDVLPYPTTGPRTPVPENIRVGPIQFATEITSDLRPISPTNAFPADVESIYATYRVRNMRRGLPIKVVWYLNGVELARQEGVWEWGSNTPSFTFFTPTGVGLYKLELYVNDTVVATNLFEVR